MGLEKWIGFLGGALFGKVLLLNKGGLVGWLVGWRASGSLKSFVWVVGE